MSSNGIRPFSHDAKDASSVCSDSSASSGYISSSDSCSDSEQGASFGETILDAARRAVDSNGLVPPDFQERFKKLGASASDLLELVRLSREATHYGLQRGLSSDPLASPQELLDCVQSNIAFEASMAADDDDFNLDTLSTNNHKVSFIAAALEQAAKFELECFQNPEREKIYQALYPLMDRELGAMLANPSADALYHIASSIGAEGLPLIRDLAQDITVLKDCLHTVAFASFRISLNSGNIFAATNWLASVDPASYFERLDKEINRAVSP
ncbi:MAG: hypothetical protein KDK78_05280, partial [Chlamydiia bacterium]|nr:hypothetical protein [Chlamydiia bacterium]